jgi:hypothetical protein
MFLYLKNLFTEIVSLLVDPSLFKNPCPIGVGLIIGFLLLGIADRIYTQHYRKISRGLIVSIFSE